jgi:hypothetical protein
MLGSARLGSARLGSAQHDAVRERALQYLVAAGLLATNRLSGSDVTLSGSVIDEDGGKNGIRPFIREILEWISYAGILMSSVLSAVLVVNESGEKLYIWYDELSIDAVPVLAYPCRWRAVGPTHS